jgi:ABC-type multidrug transport system ATPase subunit
MTHVVAELHAASRRYGLRTALVVEHLQIFENDCLAIAGTNGSGKSTLLRVLSGVTKLTKGRLETATKWNAARIAYCPQDGGLYTDLTVRENTRLAISRFFGRSSHGLYEQLSRDTGLDKFSDVEVYKLSGGFQKLAMLAITLAVNAGILLVDEPSSDLHVSHREKVAETISRAQQHYVAVVFADHSAEMLAAASRRFDL